MWLVALLMLTMLMALLGAIGANPLPMEVEMYIQINNEIYDTDKKKIIFALSYMKEGTTAP